MLNKRVVVITGGASGIGEATARLFAEKGDQVVIADVNEEAGVALAAELQGLFIKTNVADYEQVEQLIQHTIDEFGSIDVMFNNAGIGRLTPVLDQTLQDYHDVISINQHGVAYGIIAAGNAMRKLETRGVIINTASVFGYLASPGTFAYHATKGAVIMMTKSAALELAPYGIRVVGVAPGVVDTPILDGYRQSGKVEAMGAKVMGNTLTKPADIANIVYLLSLPESAAVNGSIVMADDGYASFK
ncbi:short-chain dehydrogenase [Fictibacillus macauensis ZFHKF-1]|uniref:Short-chain dehydrogenase n=1 Tax=Fictibacillus macauensis ZFHKF-1 TaxID=1196324 RepID=I8IWR1_9BACL|nr:SDR family oxidoreductase [Fictibacillus macauensis]EIT83931.1 short-chain dehydrogenase [Fictibacillus macauensis ZFHKF-1]